MPEEIKKSTREAIEKHHAENLREVVATRPSELNFVVGWTHPSHDCKTAFWKIEKGQHLIRINPIAYETLTGADKPTSPFYGKPPVKINALYRAIYDHEDCHRRFTDRDLPGLAKLLKAEKIPWQLANIFEDVRIEYKRLREGKNFGWTTWMPTADAVSRIRDSVKPSPTQLLLLYKNSLSKRGRKVRYDGDAYRSIDVPYFSGYVATYFLRKIVAAPSTRDLIPVLKEWLKRFPSTDADGNPVPENYGGGATEIGDLADAIDESTTEESGSIREQNPDGSFDEDHGGFEPREVASEAGPHGVKTGVDGTPDESTRDKSGTGGGGYGYDSSGALNAAPVDAATAMFPAEMKIATRLAQLLAKAFKEPGRNATYGPTPSKRLNIRGLCRGDYRNPYRIKRMSEIADKPHVSLVIDCSGSMSLGRVPLTNDIARYIYGLDQTDAVTYGAHGQAPRRSSKSPKSVDLNDIADEFYRAPSPSKFQWDYSTPIHTVNCSSAARIFARALNILAKKGLLTATVYESRCGGLSRKHELPVTNPHALNTIHGASSSEGLSTTLNPEPSSFRASSSAFDEIHARSKTAIVWTDGQITDAPMNRSAIHKRGLFTLGVLASDRDFTESLTEHFDAGISRLTLFGAAEALIKFIRSGGAKAKTPAPEGK